MKIWVDDIRPAPENYLWCKSVNETKDLVLFIEQVLEISMPDKKGKIIEVIDLDHDAGDYYKDGGDYIRILDWLEKTGRNYPVHLHSMNPVGVANMRSIIQKNNWSEV